jgi:MFS family permease
LIKIIANKLHGTAIQAFWAGTSFLLTSTVFQPTFASLSHVFGRREVLLVGLTFFTVGAITAALSKDFTALLVGRSIQGVGAGSISTLTYVIVTDMVSLKERGKWFSLITLMWAFGSVTGPVVGGALAEHASWVSSKLSILKISAEILQCFVTDESCSAGSSGLISRSVQFHMSRSLCF